MTIDAQQSSASATSQMAFSQFQRTLSLPSPESDAANLRPTADVVLSDKHLSFAEFQEGYVRSYIALADTKSAWTFTISSGVLVYYFLSDEMRDLLLPFAWKFPLFLAWIAVVLLLLSAFFSFRVVAPRLGSPSGEGIVFFGAVAKHKTADAFVSLVAAQSPQDLAEARLRHCYDVSLVCDKKYASLRKAVWFGMAALVATFILLMHTNL